MNYSHIQQITIVIHIVWFFLVFIRCVFTELQLCFGQCLKLHSLWIQALQCFSFDRQFFFLLGWFTGSCWTVRAGTDRTTTSGRIGFLAYRNGLFQDERNVLWRSYWWCQILWSFVWPWFWFILCTEWHRECIWRGSQQAVMTWNSPFIFISFELHTCLYIGFISGWNSWTIHNTFFYSPFYFLPFSTKYDDLYLRSYW